MNALVTWIKFEDGGKKRVPEVEYVFYPMIKIIGDDKILSWSLFLINKKFISSHQTISEIGFLMKNAPHYLLKQGVRFKLFEGFKEIANGEII